MLQRMVTVGGSGGGGGTVATMTITLSNQNYSDLGIKATEVGAICVYYSSGLWTIAFYEDGVKKTNYENYIDTRVGSNGNIEARCTHSSSSYPVTVTYYDIS